MDIKNLIAEFDHTDIKYFPYKDKVYFFGKTSVLNDIISQNELLKLKPRLLRKREATYLPLNAYQLSMVYQEIFTKNKTINAVTHVFESSGEIQLNFLESILLDVYERWPICSMKVIENDLRFYLLLQDAINMTDYIYEDPVDYLNMEEFKEKYNSYEISVFEAGQVIFIKARISGITRIVMIIHHIIYDSEFLLHLIKFIQTAIDTNSLKSYDTVPDFQFIQNNWNINQLLAKERNHIKDYWKTINFNTPAIQNTAIESTGSIRNTEINIKIDLRKFQQLLNVSPLAVVLAGSVLLLSKYLIKSIINFVLPIKQDYRNDQDCFSGYITNLVPIQINVNNFSSDKYFLQQINQVVNDTVLHSILPKEEIFDVIGLRDSEIDCILNLIKTENLEEIKILPNMFNYKTRYPITITGFVCMAEGINLKIKSYGKEEDLKIFCILFEKWINEALLYE